MQLTHNRTVTEEAREAPRLEHAVVPLDGTLLAEQAVEMTLRLAGAVVQRVTLARVVQPARSGDIAEAHRYLDEVRALLNERLAGTACAVDTVVLEGKAPEQLIEDADQAGDLVIMATHGRTGADRWAHGSMADRMVEGLRVPLLLVRVPHYLQ